MLPFFERTIRILKTKNSYNYTYFFFFFYAQGWAYNALKH